MRDFVYLIMKPIVYLAYFVVLICVYFSLGDIGFAHRTSFGESHARIVTAVEAFAMLVVVALIWLAYSRKLAMASFVFSLGVGLLLVFTGWFSSPSQQLERARDRVRHLEYVHSSYSSHQERGSFDEYGRIPPDPLDVERIVMALHEGSLRAGQLELEAIVLRTSLEGSRRYHSGFTTLGLAIIICSTIIYLVYSIPVVREVHDEVFE